MKSLTLLLFSITLRLTIIGQTEEGGVLHPGKYPCGIHEKENPINKRPIEYTYLRETDVTWEKRVWREINMREKLNQPFYFPLEDNPCRTSLFQALSRNILNGNILAFADEEFLIPLELSAIRNKLIICDSIEEIVYDETGKEFPLKKWVCDSTSIYRQITKYRLKEDWYYDKQKSVMEVRIIGLAAYSYDEEKDGYKELFWVYFPACRKYFAVSETYNFKNDAERRTLDDVFWKRQFSSQIIKESNVYDRFVSEYARGIDALVESDKIKMSLFTWEHDLWHF